MYVKVLWPFYLLSLLPSFLLQYVSAFLYIYLGYGDQYVLLCITVMIMLFSLSMEWEEAEKYATWLMKESKWSRTTYAYQKCAIQLMSEDPLSAEAQESVDTLMKYIDLLLFFVFYLVIFFF